MRKDSGFKPAFGQQGDGQADGDDKDAGADEGGPEMKRAGAYPGKGHDEEVHDEPDDDAIGKTRYPWAAGEKGYVWIKEEENKRPGEGYAIMEQDPIYYHWGAAG